MSNYQREHILCDNASTDRTLAILCEGAADDSCVNVILNARISGRCENPYNGVMASSGDAVLLFLPANLQDHQDLLPRSVELWQQGGRSTTASALKEARAMHFARSIYCRPLV